MLDLPPVGASFGVAAQVARPGAATPAATPIGPTVGFAACYLLPQLCRARAAFRGGRQHQLCSAAHNARSGALAGRPRFQMAETTCQPQFVDPHHLEWLIRRLSASSIWVRLPFFGERAVRPWRRVLWFRRAPPGPSQRAFARGWAGSRYRAEKGRGEGLLYKGLSNPSLWQLVIANPLVATAPRSDRPHGRLPQKFALLVDMPR